MAPCEKHYLTNCGDCANPVRRRVETAPAANAYTVTEALTAMQMRAEGKTYAEIGEAIGRSKQSVTQFIAKAENRSDGKSGQRANIRAQEETVAGATYRGEPYGGDEDAFLLEDNGLTTKEKAMKLGRTVYGVRNRLQRLREGLA